MDPRKRAAFSIIKILEQSGYQGYLVGGCVRDELLGKVPQDYDIATDALPENVCSLFPKTIPTGLKHGTVTVLFDSIPTEVTTFRVEGEYLDHRRPSHVDFVTSLKEDLSRRDFTINAMALDHKGQLIDYFNGQIDLREGIVRTVGKPEDRLREDPLRMLRAVRFATQFSFRLDLDLWIAIRHFREESRHLSVERVIQEIEKMWKAKKVSNGIQLLFDTGLVHSLPPFRNWGSPIEAKDKQLAQIDEIDDRIVRWAFFLSLWKETLLKQSNRLTECKFSNEDKNNIRFVLEWGCHWPTGKTEKKWKLDLLTWGLEKLLRARLLAECLKEESVDPSVEELRTWWHDMPVKHAKDLVIDGRDLLDFTQRPAGPWLGQAIRHLTTQVALGELPNEKETLLKEGCCFALDTP